MGTTTAGAAVSAPKTNYVDPTAASGGDGSLAHPFNSWSQVKFQPGNTYLQKAGTVSASGIYVGTSGTATAHIVIGAYGTGAAPTVLGSVNLDGASWVSVSGLTIRGSSGAGVVIQNGAHNDAIQNNTVQNSQMGIWIGGGAGGDTVVQNNKVLFSSSDGIALDGVSNAAGHETQILNNLVEYSGSHGIEVEANHVIVSGNTVAANGLLTPGSSGIHVYATSTNGLGSYNTISDNVAVGNQDTWANDGNGIELDQFTHNNIVSDNFSYNNQGAGIALYDSYNNTVTRNLVAANELDPGNTHTRKGELLLNEANNLTQNNTISGNTILSAFGNVPAVYVDPAAAAGNNIFSKDVLENLLHGVLFSWGAQTGATQAAWQQHAPTDTTTGIPMFAAGSSSGTYNYSFAGLPNVSLDGHTVQLVGWSAGHGLGVNFLS